MLEFWYMNWYSTTFGVLASVEINKIKLLNRLIKWVNKLIIHQKFPKNSNKKHPLIIGMCFGISFDLFSNSSAAAYLQCNCISRPCSEWERLVLQHLKNWLFNNYSYWVCCQGYYNLFTTFFLFDVLGITNTPSTLLPPLKRGIFSLSWFHYKDNLVIDVKWIL